MLTILFLYSAIQLLPIALIIDGYKLYQLLLSKGISSEILLNLLVSGISYYLYNEIAFWILDLVHPITHSIGNTIKRVVIIVASVILLNSKISVFGYVGIIVACFGTVLYAYATSRDQLLRQLRSKNDMEKV